MSSKHKTGIIIGDRECAIEKPLLLVAQIIKGGVNMNNKNQIINWLLAGDVSIQYHVHRDLLFSDVEILQNLQKRIEKEGWGADFLFQQQDNGHWGRGFYQPKWTSTHYTLLDLKNIGLPTDNQRVKQSIQMIFDQAIGKDGGVNYSKNKSKPSDLCINGMVLNIASYFKVFDPQLKIIVDLLLSLQMNDGGWNCQWFNGAKHSSLHTTILVLEGFLEYRNSGECDRENQIKAAEKKAIEFILAHQLFKSDKTGEIIDKKMTMLSFPCRWKYDILRALDYFSLAKIPFDQRMNSALEVLLKKQTRDGKWPLQNKHPGQVHFDMERAGKPSRWNTFRVLRVLDHFNL